MLAFLRHGETGPNRDGLVLGRADPELTDLGRGQAARLAELFRGAHVTRLVSSPLRRACDTAAAVASVCGLEVVTDDRLVEIDWGAWEGRPAAALSAADLGRLGGAGGGPPAGEALREVGERVGAFAEEALAEDGLVLAVTHVSPIKAAVAWALGVDGAVAMRMFVGLASVTRLAQRPAGPVLVSFNETGHLLG